MTEFTRRDFLATSLATAGAASVMSGPGAAAASTTTPAALAPWYERTMRWLQLILVESDPGSFDPQWWLDLLERSHTDGLCISGGGLCAYYPTEIPYHHISTFMKPGDDPFGAIVRGAQKLGITIVVRTDSHTCLADAAKAHPEWLNIDENGTARPHPELPDTRFITCALGPYNFDFMTRVHREITEKYRIDGLFCNRWQAQARGMCYCESCQRLFREFSGGLELPRGAGSPTQSRYAEFELARLTELWHTWDEAMRQVQPSARYFSNTGIDIDVAAQLAPTYLNEQQARGAAAVWNFGLRGKQLRTIFGGKPIIGLAGLTLNSRQSVAPAPEIKIWLLDAITNGQRPWMLKTSAVNPDQRWVPAYMQVMDWHYRNESYLRNTRNLANVAMVFRPLGNPAATGGLTPAGIAAAAAAGPMASGRGAAMAAASGFANPGPNATAGMYQALVESRIPFEMAYTRKLEPADIDRFKLLILPNLTDLTDAECEKLRLYVGRGGSLLATFETSLYDGRARRPNFALADLFGVAYAGSTDSSGLNGYMRVENATRHPLLNGLDNVGRIVATGQHANVRAEAAFNSPPLTRIPSFPTLPMEDIWARTPRTDIPEVYARTLGERSRVVYFPGDIDASYATGLAPDLALLLRNAVSWAMNAPLPVAVSGPGILDVTCWRQAHSMTVHLLNATNPFTLHAAYREDIPLGTQRVTIQMSSGQKVRAVRLLVAGTTPRFERAGDTLTVTVPTVVDHEVVAVDI